ncbi:MAG: hypothetical protein KDE15_05800 [Erythrobacter sp.]|nr:hypothetical protein [Erythrobacter sp.]
MNDGNRRSALRAGLQLGMAAALAPALASRSAAAQAMDRLIAPPPGEMRYTRRVTRSLGTDAHITVSRSFAVEFRQFIGGYMMHGRQLSAEVDAPAVLARFAELERARDESAMFPMALDPFGRILEPDVSAPVGNEVRQAVEIALHELAQQPIDDHERSELARFVSALQQAGQRVTALMPADLFAPTNTPRREEQRIALPDGGTGLVTTMFTGERDLATGLMRAAERDVTTEVSDSRRSTREHWSLSRG